MISISSLDDLSLLCEPVSLECKLANGHDGKGAFLTTSTHERQAYCATNTPPRASDAES